MKSIFGRHRIRANFYHFVSFLYVLTMILWGVGALTDMASTWIGFTLFVIDYIAQMYDPHPENPGPWFKRHFHRFYDDEEVPTKMFSRASLLTHKYFWTIISIIVIAIIPVLCYYYTVGIITLGQ